MPFGFDPNETDQSIINYVESNRVYAEVVISWHKDGTMTPMSFTLNGEEYNIKSYRFRKATPRRYIHLALDRCQIGKKIFYLFYDDERLFINT